MQHDEMYSGRRAAFRLCVSSSTNERLIMTYSAHHFPPPSLLLVEVLMRPLLNPTTWTMGREICPFAPGHRHHKVPVQSQENHQRHWPPHQ